MRSRTADAAVARKAGASRRLLVRGGLVILYFALIAITFVTGKSHTILVDNKDRAEVGFEALSGVLVSINGKEPLELYKGDRDMVKVQGQKLRVAIEPLGSGEKREAVLRIPMDEDMLLLSIPMLAAGREDCLEPFVTADQPRDPDESIGNVNEFISPDAPPSPEALLP